MALEHTLTFAGFERISDLNPKGTFMNKPKVIQLLGQARSGKDWTAEQLKLYFESQGKSVEILAYAEPMKDILSTIFSITKEELNTFKNNPSGYSINVVDPHDGTLEASPTDFRKVLQLFGNQAMKTQFGESVWADLMKSKIDQSSADIVIVSDCRFNVELETVGGFTVRVVNHGLPPPMKHASELELLDYQADHELNNTNYSISFTDITNLGKRILSCE